MWQAAAAAEQQPRPVESAHKPSHFLPTWLWLRTSSSMKPLPRTAAVISGAALRDVLLDYRAAQGDAMSPHVQSAIAMLHHSSCGLVTTCFEGKQL